MTDTTADPKLSHAEKAIDLAQVTQAAERGKPVNLRDQQDLVEQVQNEARAASGVSAEQLRSAGIKNPDAVARDLSVIAGQDRSELEYQYRNFSEGSPRFDTAVKELGLSQPGFVTKGADAQILANSLVARVAEDATISRSQRGLEGGVAKPVLERAVETTNAAVELEARRDKGAPFDPVVKAAQQYAEAASEFAGSSKARSGSFEQAEDQFLKKVGIGSNDSDALARAAAAVNKAALGESLKVVTDVREVAHNDAPVSQTGGVSREQHGR